MASGKAGKKQPPQSCHPAPLLALNIESLCIWVEVCCHTKEHPTSEVGTGIHVLISVYLYDALTEFY